MIAKVCLGEIMMTEANIQKVVVSSSPRKAVHRSRKQLTVKQLQDLTVLYKVGDSIEIISGFIARNLFLVDLLKDARQKISEYFGDEFIPRLEISYIPESNILDELWVLIPTKLPVSQALDMLDRFDEEWWLDASEQAHCKMNIKMAYV